MSAAFHIGPFRIAPHVRDGNETGGWMVDVPRRMLGKRQRRFFADRKAAEKFARELERQYTTGAWDGVRNSAASAAQHRSSRLGFAAAIEAWCHAQQARVAAHKKKRISLETDLMRLKAAVAFFGDITLSDITEDKLTAFQAHRLNVDRRRPATIKSDLIAIGKVMRWAARNGYVARVPTTDHVQEPRREVHLPTREEVGRIIQKLPARLRPVVRFLAETGCRSGEAFNLTWDRVDEINGVVEIRATESWTPKTKSSNRRIYIRGGLLNEIRRLPKAGPYVFAGASPERPINNIKKAFASAVRAADIRRGGAPLHVTPKTLRKVVATCMALELRVPQRLLQDWLGHTPGSRVTDQYYVMPLEEAKRQVNLSLSL